MQFALKDNISGVFAEYIKSNKFKTVRMSVSFLTKSDRKTLPAAAMLSKLLTRSCQKYPTHVDLSKHLNMLYGARIMGGCVKIGDSLLVKFTAEALSPKYTPNNEDTLDLCSQLLGEIIFAPKLSQNGSFEGEDFDIEKRQLLDSIDARINNKRGYAINRMLKEMCGDDPFGIPAEGYREDAEKITPRDLYELWQNLITNSPVYLTAVGEGAPDNFFNSMAEKFSRHNRNAKDYAPTFKAVTPSEIKEASDSMDVAQGKLVLGFRTDISSLEQDNLPLRMMIDIFGGAPYSRLFTEVREKQSLCYYCAARLFAVKGIVCVDSGVEFDRVEQAKEGILDQLEVMKKGRFDDSIILASKMGMKDAVKSAYDSPAELEGWYLSRLFDKESLTPEEFVNRIDTITREDIIKAANSIKLDTVYLLKGVENNG